MTTHQLKVVTYNIHKGFSSFNRRWMLHELRQGLQDLAPDIVFLQEVQGLHLRHACQRENWPKQAQHEFLATELWPSHIYAHNATYPHGHHGNAILSRWPIVGWQHQDVTHLRFERRGFLHCQITLQGGLLLHCVCVHLSLFALSRKRQLRALTDYLQAEVPQDAPLLIAGDFNDWQNRASPCLQEHLGMLETFGLNSVRPAKSFPALWPFFRLDRIYVRHFQVEAAAVYCGAPWKKISDHVPLSANLRYNAVQS